MKNIILSLCLFLFVVFVNADLPEECNYVNTTYKLTDADKVKKCFEETYLVDQDIIDVIIRNLEIIRDYYPYTDIAKNPPSEPAGYFPKVDFAAGLEDLKAQLASSNRIVSKVFRPTQKFIKSLNDGHFSLNTNSIRGKYENIFDNVNVMLPFKWNAAVEGDTRKVYLNTPLCEYLSEDECDTLEDMINGKIPVATVDGKDAFIYFSTLLGDYTGMKSPQGSLFINKALSNKGFNLLSYPVEGLYDNHTIVFSDDSRTTVTFRFGFVNNRNAPKSVRDEMIKSPSFDHLGLVSAEKEKKIEAVLKNFKKRSVRQEHTLIPCGIDGEGDNTMNYISVDTFSPSDEELYVQELEECVAMFDKNSYPITVILPVNGGGSALLRALLFYLLMPASDFRANRAVRKTDNTHHIAVDEEYLLGSMSGNKETCDAFASKQDIETFWKNTITDDLGGGITHQRTEKLVEGYKEKIKGYSLFKLTKNVRKPTDIIVATDGFCFSACSFFVYNTKRAGGAIIAGYGLTNPGDDLFAAGQCPSSVTSPADYFDEVKNNTAYGLVFQATTTESYDISNQSDKIPGDYTILRVDVHTGYYDDYDPVKNIPDLLKKTREVRTKFQTSCNPSNKKLLFITDQCKTDKPNAVSSGYACGSDGKWDKSTCKVATCKEGYIVDFEKDECVINPCYPQDSSSSSTSKASGSFIVHPSASILFMMFLTLLYICVH